MSGDRFDGGPLAGRLDRRPVGAVYAGLLSLVVLAIAGAVGLALKQPWLFPSLGPTVMLFFQSPQEPAARPINSLVGHLVGIIAGYGSYLALGLNGAPSVPDAGLTVPYLVAGVVSVAVTTAVLALVDLPHPPAGATTLIISLGILAKPLAVLSMAGAVLLITIAGWGANRAFLGRRA